MLGLQVLKRCLEGVLQSDVLTNMLNLVKDPAMLHNLSCWVREFLALAEASEAQQWLHGSSFGPQLCETFESAARFCRAIAYLFQLECAGKPCLDDVSFFVEYSGPCVWRKSIKSLMRNPEPHGPNFSDCRAQSRELLRTLYQDAIKTAATSGPAMQLLGTLQSKLESSSAQLFHGSCRCLAEVLRHLEELEGKLRQGATKKLRSTAIDFTQKMVEQAPGCSSSLCVFLHVFQASKYRPRDQRLGT